MYRFTGSHAREFVGQFCAEIENLCGVVHPDDEHYQGSGGAIGGPWTRATQIQGQQQLAEGKQQRGHDGSGTNIPPLDFRVRHVLKNQRKQQRDSDKRDDEIHGLPEDACDREDSVEELRHGR